MTVDAAEAERIRQEVFDNLQRGVRGDLDQAKRDVEFLSLKVREHDGLKGWLDQLAQTFARRIDQHAVRMEIAERRVKRTARRAKRLRYIRGRAA